MRLRQRPAQHHLSGGPDDHPARWLALLAAACLATPAAAAAAGQVTLLHVVGPPGIVVIGVTAQ
jgi:hypothetical protein